MKLKSDRSNGGGRSSFDKTSKARRKREKVCDREPPKNENNEQRTECKKARTRGRGERDQDNRRKRKTKEIKNASKRTEQTSEKKVRRGREGSNSSSIGRRGGEKEEQRGVLYKREKEGKV